MGGISHFGSHLNLIERHVRSVRFGFFCDRIETGEKKSGPSTGQRKNTIVRLQYAGTHTAYRMMYAGAAASSRVTLTFNGQPTRSHHRRLFI